MHTPTPAVPHGQGIRSARLQSAKISDEAGRVIIVRAAHHAGRAGPAGPRHWPTLMAPAAAVSFRPEGQRLGAQRPVPPAWPGLTGQ